MGELLIVGRGEGGRERGDGGLVEIGERGCGGYSGRQAAVAEEDKVMVDF